MDMSMTVVKAAPARRWHCVLPTPFPASVDDISDAVIYLASDLSSGRHGNTTDRRHGATKV